MRERTMDSMASAAHNSPAIAVTRYCNLPMPISSMACATVYRADIIEHFRRIHKIWRYTIKIKSCVNWSMNRIIYTWGTWLKWLQWPKRLQWLVIDRTLFLPNRTFFLPNYVRPIWPNMFGYICRTCSVQIALCGACYFSAVANSYSHNQYKLSRHAPAFYY